MLLEKEKYINKSWKDVIKEISMHQVRHGNEKNPENSLKT